MKVLILRQVHHYIRILGCQMLPLVCILFVHLFYVTPLILNCLVYQHE